MSSAEDLTPGPATPARTPTRVGRYRLGACIGRGSYGAVHRAHDPQLDREVAIKLLSSRRVDEDVTRLAREARAIAQLSHPNIVQVYDVGRTDDGLFIAMELLRGETLRAWVQAQRAREPVDWRAIVRMFVATGRGLAAAHARGLIHRDFKPDNVMVTEAGVPKVLDFGLARATDDVALAVSGGPLPERRVEVGAAALAGATTDRVALTATGLAMGTPRYMAPEQHAGHPLGAAADQFAFCVALFEAVFGTPPFTGVDVEELAMAKHRGRIVRTPVSTVPTAIDDLVRRGLRADLGRRHPDLATLLDRLERQLRPRRRHWWWAIGTVGAVGFAVTLRAGADSCDADARVRASWDSARKVEIAEAFARSGVDDAVRTWSRLEPRFDDYFAQWQVRYEAACRGGSGRVACLRRSLGSVQATLHVLAEADADVVHHAMSSAGALLDLDECEQRDVESARPEVADPALEVAYARLHGASALYNAGKVEAADGRVRALAEDPVVVADARLQAEVLQLLGLTTPLIRADESRAAYERAYFLLDELSDRDGAMDLATRLATMSASVFADPAEASRWLRYAQTKVPVEDMTVRQQAAFAGAQAALASARGDELEASGHMRRVIELYQSLDPPDPYSTAKARHDLANHLVALSQWEQAQAELEAALAIWYDELGPRHPNIALTSDALGSVYAQRGEHERAVKLHRRALEIAEDVLGEDEVATANARTNLGIALTYAGHLEEAEQQLTRALELYDANVDDANPLRARARLNLGLTYAQQGNLEAARRVYETAAHALEITYGPDHPLVAISRLNLADALLGLGRDADALQAVELAWDVIQRAYPQTAYAAAAHTTYGRALLATGRADKAVGILESALDLYEQQPSRPEHVAEARFALARALHATGAARGRVEMLAGQARTFYAAGDPADPSVAEIDAFVAAL